MTEEEKKELAELIGELVSKAGPTTGQIKANQDPVKVARLIELGWTPTKEKSNESRDFSERLKKIEETLIDHEKRITTNSIRR